MAVFTNGGGRDQASSIRIKLCYMNMSPETEQLFPDLILETADKSERYYHHCHAQSSSQYTQPYDKRGKIPFLAKQITARYEKRQIQDGSKCKHYGGVKRSLSDGFFNRMEDAFSSNSSQAGSRYHSNKRIFRLLRSVII